MGNLENLGRKIEEEKTNQKLEAMEQNKVSRAVKQEDQERAIANKDKVFLPGQCVPEEIQNLKSAKKLAIVGFADSWCETPWDDKSFDIWGINELYLQMKQGYGKECRYTHWWEIHNPYSPTKNSKKHHEWLRQCKVPIFMQKHFEEFPMSVPIPKNDIEDFYNQNFLVGKMYSTEGAVFSDYSNQISVMVAMAVMMDYEEIHIYGVDMAQSSEYAWQRAACQFFIGYAAGMGKKVLIPITSELCKYPNFYGFNTDNYVRMQVKHRIKVVKGLAEQHSLQAKVDDHTRQEQKVNFTKQIGEIEAGLQKIDDELVKNDIIIHKNQELVEFLSSAPKDSKEFNRKVEIALSKITKQSTDIDSHMKVLQDQKKELLKQRLKLSQQDFVWEKCYQDAKKTTEVTLIGFQGIIGECNRLLNNNLV